MRVEIPAQAAAMGGEIIPDHLAKKLEPDFERRLAASRDFALRPVMRAAVARHEIIEIGC
ncbi:MULTISPECIES: hypothetical protein [Bradyrhizobium]|uniref:hypothetical protein n=1 Tax=Bradyrhizobium TaxID=374 RepID=UPI00067EC9F5|nr:MULTISPECIES: hypothetical protein [Bradyrhizobium]PAY05659.1 hypothetical protein CK489_22065 [Bradyrhizobium sp. UFLA03-84]